MEIMWNNNITKVLITERKGYSGDASSSARKLFNEVRT